MITGSQSIYDNESYKSVKDSICGMNIANSDMCNVFGNLYNAGVAYLFFELLALLFLFVWIFQVIWALMEKPLKKWWIPFLWPGISFFFHLLAICIWAGVTKSNFEDNCLSKNSNNLCSTNGPALAILTVFLYLFFGAIYVFVHIYRDGIVKSSPEKAAEEEERRI